VVVWFVEVAVVGLVRILLRIRLSSAWASIPFCVEVSCGLRARSSREESIDQ
jgi:hypothetical protein